MKKISTVEEFTQLLATSEKFLLLKHSVTCPISRSGYNATSHFEAGSPVSIYFLVVQESRPLSNHIAETFGIRHESPQILLFENGEVKWTTSHYSISETNLKEHVK